MKLIRCHIENFGILHDFDYVFNAGINVIHAENGWGKSTLASFIRVMFYGFDKETKELLYKGAEKIKELKDRWCIWRQFCI